MRIQGCSAWSRSRLPLHSKTLPSAQTFVALRCRMVSVSVKAGNRSCLGHCAVMLILRIGFLTRFEPCRQRQISTLHHSNDLVTRLKSIFWSIISLHRPSLSSSSSTTLHRKTSSFVDRSETVVPLCQSSTACHGPEGYAITGHRKRGTDSRRDGCQCRDYSHGHLCANFCDCIDLCASAQPL